MANNESKCNNSNNNNNIDMVRIERIGYKQNENREKAYNNVGKGSMYSHAKIGKL